jgi:hypothetical protein
MREKIRLLSFLLIVLGLFIQPALSDTKLLAGTPPISPTEGAQQVAAYLPGLTGTSALTIPSTSSKITSYPFTIEMWVRPNAITAYGGFFYDKNGTSGTNKTCLQFANATTGEMRFDLFGGATVVPLTSATKLAVGKWQHLAVIVTSDSAIVEIDGTFYSAAHTKAFTSLGVTTSTLGLDVDVAARMFNGSMDEVRIWKSARTREQIRLYKDSVLRPTSETNLVAYYNFNDGTINDLTANALNLTKGTTVLLSNVNSDARISSISNTIGFLTPAFHPDTLTYSFYAPQSSLLKATTLNDGSIITGAPVTPTVATPNVTITGTSKDGTATKNYLVKTSFMPVSSWNGGTATGTSSYPYSYGWDITPLSGTAAWNVLNTSPGIRFVDNLTTYKNEDGSTFSGRAMYIRWDGSGAAPITSYYNYPMYLEGGKTYHMGAKLGWNSNSSGTGIYTYSINSAKDNTGYSLGSKTLSILSTNMLKLYNVGLDVTPKTSGVYYLTITNNLPLLGLLANLTVAESTVPTLHSNVATVAFTEIKKSNTFTVGGSLLTDTVKLTAPVGITLSRTILTPAEAATGFDVTATYNYQAAILSGKIAMTSGTATDTVRFTYTPPKVSIYEQDVEVENNGTAYPLTVASVSNSVDSLYVTASTGLTLTKRGFSNADFVAGGGAIKVYVSSTVAGTSGTLTFSSRSNSPTSNLDTVNVLAVAPYIRYYIKHKASNFVMGSYSTGLYPALTTAQGLVTQKFILRRTAPLSLTDTTFYILQDTAYRAVRKVAASGWDTEFGIPSNEAKWTIQQKGGGVVTLTNAVTAKVLGTDAGAVNGRMYDDKVWAAAGNMEWVIQTIPVMNVTTKVLPTFKTAPTTSVTNSTKIGGTNITGNIKVVLSGAGAAQFKVSYDSLVSAAGIVKDSILTVTYAPAVYGTHVAKLTISTSMTADVVIDLTGIAVKDATASIVNSTIEAASGSVVPNGWTISKGTGNSYTNTGQHYSLVTTNRYLDSWNGTTGSMIYNASQVVKNIPNGIYDLSAAARTSGLKSYVFANTKQTEIINNGGAGGALGNGWNTIVVDKVVVLDSSITIGAKTVTGWTGTWFSVDDFKLSYYGEGDFASYKSVLDSLIAKSERFDLTTTPNGEDAALASAIATAKAATDANGVLAAYKGLNVQYNINAASVAAYAKLKALVASATTLSNTTSYNATALTTFKAAITAADGVYNAGTTMTADVNTAITVLTKAQYDYKVLQPAPADFTFVLANPSFEEGTTAGVDLTSVKGKGGSYNTPNGWNAYCVVDTATTGCNMVNINSTTAMSDGNNGFETWATNGMVRVFNVSQKIVAPSTGYYLLSGNLRCDASSPSLTDPLKFDGHVYAKVGAAAEVSSIKLAEAAGLITGTGWNTKAAWRTLSLVIKANAGDTIKLGAASTSFMQMDNFSLSYRGNNNPATIDVAYITKSKVMNALADSVQNDPVYRMLSRDPKLNVTLKVLTDVSATATFDQSPYDAIVIQESLGGGDAILFPAGALGLSKLTVPTIYNKTYAFKAGRALASGATGTGAEATVGVFSMKVDTANWTNPLLRGITIVADTVQLFTKPAQDDGAVPTAVTTTMKALNVANSVIGTEGTLLAYPKGMTTSPIFFNNVVAPDTIGGQPIKTRMILFGMNYGAQCRDHGMNMTQANYTLWRNAVYSLVGLDIPTTPAAIPAVLNVSATTVPAMTATVGATASNTIKVGGYSLTEKIKVTLSGANASQFKLSFDTLAIVDKIAKDSVLTITYQPTDAGSHTATLTISSLNATSNTIILTGSAKKDLTSLIVNPGVDAASGNVQPLGWTVDKGAGNSITNTGQHYSLVTTNRYLDSWNGTAGAMIYNAKQVVKNVPNGIYDMTAAARTSGLGSYVFANDAQTEIINNGGAGGTLGNGWSPITAVHAVVMDSTITIGAKTVTGWTGTWFSVDDFTLTYYGPGDFASYKTVLDSLIAKAKRFDLATSPDGLDVLLSAAITTGQAASDATTALSAYTGLKKAYDANVASVAAFTKLQALIASSTTLSNTTSYNATALTTFKAAITTADGVAKAATTLPVNVDAAIVALNKALYDYKVLQPAPADFTFVLANPSFELGTTTGIDPKSSVGKVGSFNTPIGWNAYANVDTTATGLNMVSIYSTTTMAEGNYGFETWAQGTKIRAFNVSQKIVAPATGYYTLSGSLRCDGSSPSTTDPKLYDGHVYAQVGSAPEVASKKLAEMAGLITGTGWNTKAAWRTMNLSFKANAGDTIKLGAASTSFMQMDNFTLGFRGNNNPATLDVAYITFQKTMDASADSVQADPVYRMLAKDTLLNVSLKVLTDVSATATFDMTPYDALVIQESFSSTAAILKPGSALAIAKLTAPTLINKTYTFKAGGVFATGAAGAGAEAAVGTFAIKVDSINKSNALFRGLTFAADTVQLFIAGAADNGAITATPLTAATCKALNGSNGVIGAEGTLLAYPVGMTPAISINDILAGDTIGGQVTGARIITMNMNFGAMCREHGKKMTNANYTLWRNAVYSLVGLPVPSTPMNIITEVAKPAEANGSSIVVYPNPTTSYVNISNLNLNSIVKIFSMTGQQVFMGKADSNIMTVDMSRFNNGMYMLQVVSNGKALKSKIIKK